MNVVTSTDGTRIAYTREGSGPAVILDGGALDDGTENAALGPALAGSFTVYNYARLGRGDSGDTAPHSLAKEIEDLATLLEIAGQAHLFGPSSGGALALEAATAGARVRSIAVFDVPYSIAPDAVSGWQAYVGDLHAALADNDRDLALQRFMRMAGIPDEAVAEAKGLPYWDPMLPLEHTLAYDAACLNDGSPPRDRVAAINQPLLVVTRSAPGPDREFFADAADATAASIAAASRQTVDVPSHVVDADALAPALIDFFER